MLKSGDLIQFKEILQDPPKWYDTLPYEMKQPRKYKMLIRGSDDEVEGEYGIIIHTYCYEQDETKYSYIVFCQNSLKEFHVFDEEIEKV